MFRRLAEAFQGGDDSHQQYINNQNSYFNALPNMILSPTSGLKGFDVAIQSIDSQGRAYQKPPVKQPNRIFMQDSSPDLNNLAKQCASSSVDELIAIKNPNAAIGCGWAYTPPNQGSPYPVVSKGAIGDSNGALPNFGTPEYKKYFFDLQLAKKQILLDKCRALKACTDVDSDVFSGTCGYCTDTNQGIPIDSAGQPLYGGDPLGTCSPQSIVTSGANCPPPGSGPGPQPIIDKSCDPVNGRLPAACLYNQVIAAGCSDSGTLAIALSNPSDPSNYIGSILNGDAVKIYNRVANPPLSMNTFNQGAATVNAVLNEARQLAGNTSQPANSALGAAARDLCLQKGALSQYNFCNDISDSTMPPFDMGCLQQLFRKMGGQPTGTAYPSDGTLYWTTNNTMPTYNSMSNIGAVKQYINTIIANMNSSDYNTQRTAMTQFLGITPDQLIKRAPYTQGVEVIWMLATPGTSRISGVLKRTIEKDFVQFGGSSSNSSTYTFPQVGVTNYVAMMQLTDVRAPQDFAIKWSFFVDDGAWISVNQPSTFDYTAETTPIADQPGYVANVQLQSASYNFNSCQPFSGTFPNITKVFYTDAGGGEHSFNFHSNPCSGSPILTSPYYSLTLEPRAPFINFEVNLNNSNFEDTRNPGIFGQLCTNQGLEYHTKSTELTNVPGNKGFVRYNNATSYTNLFNIAYQAWGTVTFAFRLQTMPVKDGIFSFWVYNKYCDFYLVPNNGSTAKMRYQTNMIGGSTSDHATDFNLQLGTWYYMEVAQNGQGFDVYCDSIPNIIKNSNYTTQYSRVGDGPITTNINNGLYVAGQSNSCNITVGGQGSGFKYYSSTFQFDLAWVHFFDTYINGDDLGNDVRSLWKFTQFPKTFNTY
jgi:hypothetical protein